MKRILLLALVLAACSTPDMSTPLERIIRTAIVEADSARTPDSPPLSVAVSVVDPSTGFELHVNGERLFHAASTMKCPSPPVSAAKNMRA